MRAFTLIEIVIYIALFGMFMSGLMQAVSRMQELSDRSSAKAIVLEEGIPLLEALERGIGNGDAVSAIPIASDRAAIKRFESTPVSGNGSEPAYEDIKFTLEAQTEHESSFEHEFSVRLYRDTP